MSPEAFETAVAASERPQTHGLGRAATGTSKTRLYDNVMRITLFYARVMWTVCRKLEVVFGAFERKMRRRMYWGVQECVK